MACTASVAVGVAGVGDGCAGVRVAGSEVGLVLVLVLPTWFGCWWCC